MPKTFNELKALLEQQYTRVMKYGSDWYYVGMENNIEKRKGFVRYQYNPIPIVDWEALWKVKEEQMEVKEKIDELVAKFSPNMSSADFRDTVKKLAYLLEGIEEGPFFKQGKFYIQKSTNEKYICSRVGYDLFSLVCLNDGNNWNGTHSLEELEETKGNFRETV